MQPAETSGQVPRREDVAGAQGVHQAASQFHRKIQVAQRRQQSGAPDPPLDYHQGRRPVGVNLRFSPLLSQAPVNVGQVPRAPATALFADAAQVNTFLPPASADNPMLEEFYYVSTNQGEATAHFRHAQRANVAFGDGHVAAEKMSPGSLDQNLPEQFVGRLRTEVLAPQ